MRRYIYVLVKSLIVLAFVVSGSIVYAQQGDQNSIYGYPLKDVSGYLSANFGEMRPNHFHSGIDFKTDGVENKPVLAVADGYVSRVVLSHSGYGRAIYITHNNGSVSVYGHLLKYMPQIEEYVWQERIGRRKNRLDLYFSREQFPVTKGQEIGRSGNTGNSFGPHLHFELRTANGKTTNLLAQGLYRPKDDIPPYIFRLHYVEVDSIRGVPCHSRLSSYEVEKVEKGVYRLKESKTVEVGRRGYFIVEVSDRKSNVANRFGVYSLRASIDQKCYYEYRMDGFTFDFSRYCNAVSHYPLQINSRNEVMRLARIDGCPRSLLQKCDNQGLISLAESQRANVEIVAEDDSGCTSTLKFEICGKPKDRCFVAEQDTISPIIDRRYAFRYKQDSLSVLIPRYALYESMFYKQQRLDMRVKSDSTVVVLSPVYRLLDRTVPLHSSILVAIKADVPDYLRSRAKLATLTSKGKISVLGGEYSAGQVEAQVRTLGDYFIVADVGLPTIKPKFERGADLSGKESVDIAVKDNVSSISSWAASIDGVWQPLDYHPVRGVVTLSLKGVAKNQTHSLTIRISDSSGNSQTHTTEFKY